MTTARQALGALLETAVREYYAGKPTLSDKDFDTLARMLSRVDPGAYTLCYERIRKEQADD